MSEGPVAPGRRSLVADLSRTPPPGSRRRGRRPGIRRARLIGGVVAVAGLAVIVGVVVGRAHGPLPPVGCSVASTATPGGYSITPSQAQNAAIIAAVALRKGMP